MAINLTSLTLPLRLLQAAFALIVLGVLAYAAHIWPYNTPSSISFLIFTSVFTLLALAYLVLAPTRFPRFAHTYVLLGVEVVTMLFWFAGFIALASKMDDVQCGSRYGRRLAPCKAGIAGDVFSAFEWLLFAITTAIAAMAVFRGRSGVVKHDTAVHTGPGVQGV